MVSDEFLRLCSGGEVAVKDDYAGELSSPSPPDIRRHLHFSPATTHLNSTVPHALLLVRNTSLRSYPEMFRSPDSPHMYKISIVYFMSVRLLPTNPDPTKLRLLK